MNQERLNVVYMDIWRNYLTRALFALVILMICAQPAAAKVIKLNAEDQAALIDGATRVELIPYLKDLSSEVRNSIRASTYGEVMADKDERFQVGDVEGWWWWERNLPHRRFLWAARIGSRYVIHYEVGGRGHDYQIVLISTDGGQKEAKLVWAAVANGPLANFPDFILALKAGELDDTLDYYH
jgi:hypothetical protein